MSNLAVGSASALAFPYISQSASHASAAGKLNVACVGLGHMGSYAVKEAEKENFVALCDVDWRPDEAIWGDRNPAKTAAENPQAGKFSDFRRMLDKMHKNIDAVMVSTPDHCHFPAAMAAMEYGKHVFVQKPLAHNIWQLRTLQKAARHYGVKTNMGNQGHTFEGARLIKEWYDNGVLGEVREVHCWTDRPRGPWFIKPDSIPPAKEHTPKDVDWDIWQGPTAERPFSSEYVPTKWRAWWDYGVGCLGDIGCHCIDTPYWTLDLGLPTAVDVMLDEPANELFTPFGAQVIFHFPARGSKPPVTLHWYEGRPRPPLLEGMKEFPSNGMYMLGSKEIAYHEDMRPVSPQLWPRERMLDYKDVLKKRNLPRVEGGPIQELFRDIKGEGPRALSNFDYSAALTEVILLGALAIRLGHRIEWNPETMQVTNVPGLEHLVKEPVRKGWSFGENLWT
ncbi:MAG: Gfo/Idh/MocA family oxidoreductase [Verrucomicrobiae bacterium]|nr:Gfo/Idh/MocA family oxidoreductase [Verrucomicrobiae bacterium]